MAQSKWNVKDRQPRSVRWFSLDTPKSYAVIFFCVLALIWGVWQYVNYDAGPYEISQDTPVIRAEPGPYRMRPQNYGHVKVPHEDKVIFDVMQDSSDELDHVGTQSSTEEPLPLEKSTPGTSADLPVVAPDPFTEITADEAKENAKQKPTALHSHGRQESTPGDALSSEDKISPDVRNGSSVNPPTRAEIAQKGEYWVRMATTQTYDGALSEWSRVSDKFHSELNGKEGTVAMIELDNGKKLYPLYVGPYDTMDVARKTCAKMRDRIGCMTERLKQ